MMDLEEFRREAHKMVDFMADYLASLEEYPVKSRNSPGEVYDSVPNVPPPSGEGMDVIMADFNKNILPGMTHWQSPNFYAYFPANSSYPSLLAEMLTATMGAQCMIWDTSPAAAELEEKMMDWLKNAMRLPESWQGVIQDTASTATLCAILTAREVKTDFTINKEGVSGKTLRVYCSTETHSSIEKAVKIAGLGSRNLVKIPVDENNAMIPAELEKSIIADKAKGFIPCCVVGALGTTGTCAVDPVKEISGICKEHDVWFHIDAAYAGSALLLPEYSSLLEGIEDADSFVFNPHKWLFTNFDCTAYYVKDADALIKTFSILPEYLKTDSRGQVNDYRDWGVPLGRRFRALKLWFVLRNFGMEEILRRLRFHISLAEDLEKNINDHPDFEMVTPRNFNLVCFRFAPKGKTEEELEALNKALLKQLNDSGKVFLTHTKVKGTYVIRMVTGQTYLEQRHVEAAWELIKSTASGLS